MTLRYVRRILALLVLLGVSAFTATTMAAPEAGLSWEVVGKGSGTASLSFVSSSGPARPQHVGSATYSLELSSPGPFIFNGVGGLCEFITGRGAITAADGSTIFFATVGTLCNEANGLGGEFPTSPLHYNGTYRITGGNGRFTGVAGGGNLAATFNATHFIKIDGTITGL